MMKLTKETQIADDCGINIVKISHLYPKVQKQILEDHENAINYKAWYEISKLDKEKLEQNLDTKIEENKKLKEKIGTVLADSHIANEQMTNANLELEQLKEKLETLREFLRDPLNNPEAHAIVFHNPEYGKFLKEEILEGKES